MMKEVVLTREQYGKTRGPIARYRRVNKALDECGFTPYVPGPGWYHALTNSNIFPYQNSKHSYYNFEDMVAQSTDLDRTISGEEEVIKEFISVLDKVN